MAAPLLTRLARKLHRRSLSQRATKPTKGLERGLTDSLQWKEEHRGVVLRLTGEGKKKRSKLLAPGSTRLQNRLRRCASQSPTKALTSVAPTEDKRRGGKRKKEKASVAYPSPGGLKAQGEEWGVGRPFKGPHPPLTMPRARWEVERRDRRETGSKMTAGGLFGK